MRIKKLNLSRNQASVATLSGSTSCLDPFRPIRFDPGVGARQVELELVKFLVVSQGSVIIFVSSIFSKSVPSVRSALQVMEVEDQNSSCCC